MKTDDSYRRYISLLLQLHDLSIAGKDDSAEADEIRDEMDQPWRSLTAAEIERVERISADLHLLEEAFVTRICHLHRHILDSINNRHRFDSISTGFDYCRRFQNLSSQSPTI